MTGIDYDKYRVARMGHFVGIRWTQLPKYSSFLAASLGESRSFQSSWPYSGVTLFIELRVRNRTRMDLLIVLWCGGFLLLRFSSPFRSDVDQLVPFSFLASGPAAILASTSAEHEQAFSELQSIAMAVTAQHQGTDILESRTQPVLFGFQV